MRIFLWILLLTGALSTLAFAQEVDAQKDNERASSDLTLDELRAARNIVKEFRQRCNVKLDVDAALNGLAVADWQKRSAQENAAIFSDLLQDDLPEDVRDKLKHQPEFDELCSASLTILFQGFLYTALVNKPEQEEFEFPAEIAAMADLLLLRIIRQEQVYKINSQERLQQVLFAHQQAIQITGRVLENLKTENPDQYEMELKRIFQIKADGYYLHTLEQDEMGMKKGTRVISVTAFPFVMTVAKIAGDYKIIGLTFYSE